MTVFKLSNFLFNLMENFLEGVSLHVLEDVIFFILFFGIDMAEGLDDAFQKETDRFILLTFLKYHSKMLLLILNTKNHLLSSHLLPNPHLIIKRIRNHIVNLVQHDLPFGCLRSKHRKYGKRQDALFVGEVV